MGLRVAEVRRVLEPENIFKLLPEDVFLELERGFFHGLGRGVVLLWAEYDKEKNKWIVDIKNRLEPHPSIPKKKPTDFSIFCWELRQKFGPEVCLRHDSKAAQDFVDEILKVSGPYKCWAKVNELAYPLHYGGGVRAVLLAGGQNIPTDEEGQGEIQDAILKQPDGDKHWEYLEDYMKQEIERQIKLAKETSPKEAWERLENIGKGLQGVINQAYESRADRAMAILQEDLRKIFAHADLSDRAEWWIQIKEIFEDFRKITELNDILVLRRRGGRYYWATEDSKPVIKVRDVVNHIPQDQLLLLESEKDIFKESIPSFNRKCPWRAFRTEHRSDRLVVSTLIFINGKIPKEREKFVADFCRSAAGFKDMAEIVFQVEEARLRYEYEIGSIAHSFRTPMQNILFELDNQREIFTKVEDQVSERRVETIANRVFDIKTDINIMLHDESDKFEEIDIVRLIRKVMHNLKPQAQQKKCSIKPKGDWPDRAIVRASLTRLRGAFSDLFDNAVKYSWDNRPIWVEIKEQGDYVNTTIENYGLGIPSEMLLELGQLGFRGESVDLKRPRRTGTGWGIPVATTTIESIGGFLEMGSWPADDQPRKANEKYHRYKTQVEVILPLNRKNYIY